VSGTVSAVPAVSVPVTSAESVAANVMVAAPPGVTVTE